MKQMAPATALVLLLLLCSSGTALASAMGAGSVFSCDLQPVGVELGTFGARPGTNSVVLRWETSYEIDRVGFNLYRASRAGGVRVQVNEDLIASQTGPGSVSGASYQYVDALLPRPGTYYYWLEMVGIAGENELYGPIRATAGGGKKQPSAEGVHPGPGWY